MANMYFPGTWDSTHGQGCDGTLITSKIILLAAHCVFNGTTGARVGLPEVRVTCCIFSLDEEPATSSFALASLRIQRRIRFQLIYRRCGLVAMEIFSQLIFSLTITKQYKQFHTPSMIPTPSPMMSHSCF